MKKTRYINSSFLMSGENTDEFQYNLMFCFAPKFPKMNIY